MKKIIAFALALALVVIALVSCGKTTPQQENTDPVGKELSAEGVPFKFFLVAGENGRAATATISTWMEITSTITIPETVEYNGHTYPITVVGMGQNIMVDSPSTLTSISFSKNVKTISDRAFTMCVNLSKVSFGESVETIGNMAFSGTAITSVVLPDSARKIVRSAFFGCSKLDSVIINNDIETLEDMAFGFCSSITTIQIPRSFADRIEGIFSGCAKVVDGTVRVLYPN